MLMKKYKVYCNIEGSTFRATITATLHISEVGGYYRLTDANGTESYYPINRTVIDEVTE